MDFYSLAEKYQTPFYLYDFNYIQKRYEALKEEFKARSSLICYAVKANSNLSILKFLSELGSGFDCVSANEIRRALLAGAEKYKIIFSGVGKTEEELLFALKEDILFINVESSEELKLLEKVAKKENMQARISLRVNPDIDAKTHPYISTGLKDNKFGVSVNEARKLYLYAKNSEHLQPVGLHFHIGSQITKLEPILEASAIAAQLLKELKAINIDIKFFDIGGGIGVQYKDEIEPDLKNYVQGILKNLSQDLTILCEPGRYLVANSGIFVNKILYEKNNGDKRFIVVDGAMNDLLRPSLYKAHHEIEILSDEKREESLSDVVGGICESGDFLAKDRLLPKVKSGELLLVKSAGAYGFSMSSNYNSRCRVAEVGFLNGKDFLIRKRESFEDLVKLEEACL